MTRTTQNHILALSPELRDILQKTWPSIEQIATSHRCSVKIICSTRTQQEQDALWEIGRSLPGRRVTWTRHSKHQDGHAVDLALFQDGFYLDDQNPVKAYGIYEEIAEHLKKHGLKWLGPIGDDAHFELP